MCCLLAHTRPVFTLCREPLTTCPPVSKWFEWWLNKAVRAISRLWFLVRCFLRNRCAALTCAHSGVYIAALPGKKGGGCLSDQAGD